MWNDLTMQQRADIISMAVKAGIKDMSSIRSFYNESVGSRRFDDGGFAPNGAYSLSRGVPIRTVELPEVTVIGDKFKYLSKRHENIKNKVKSVVGFFTGGNDEVEESYRDAVVPYGKGSGHERDNIINIKNGKAGEMDRLGMYGAERGEDGIYRFRNPNYVPSGDKSLQQAKVDLGFGNATDYEFLKWCAENANRLNSSLGKPTAGNAWTRHGIYGDSVIVQAPFKKSDYHGIAKPNRYLSDQGKYIEEHIDEHDLYTGDIVDMRHGGSNFTDTAWREGDPDRANTHTGTILKTGPDKEHTYVVHSTGNGLNVQPIGELLGSGIFKKSYITGIRRPGTKNHPYTKDLGGYLYDSGGSIHIAPSKRGTFTAAATKHGMGVQEFASKVLAHPENYSLTMRKKANFARNASHWKH